MNTVTRITSPVLALGIGMGVFGAGCGENKKVEKPLPGNVKIAEKKEEIDPRQALLEKAEADVRNARTDLEKERAKAKLNDLQAKTKIAELTNTHHFFLLPGSVGPRNCIILMKI